MLCFLYGGSHARSNAKDGLYREVESCAWTAKDGRGQLSHEPALFRGFVDGYGRGGTEILQSEIFALYEALWLLRVFNFEVSKQESGLERAPGYPEAAVYAEFLTDVLARLPLNRQHSASLPHPDHT